MRKSIHAGSSLGPRILMAGLIDGPGPNAFGVYYASTPEEAKRLVAKYHDAGFEQIKIYSLVTPAMVEAICAEAHRLGMTVTGHVPNGMTIVEAAAAGMDHIAHLPIRGEAGIRRGQHDDRLPERSPHRRSTRRSPGASCSDTRSARRSRRSSRESSGFRRRSTGSSRTPGRPASTPRPRGRASNAGCRIVKALHDAGVPVVVGTDEGVPGHSVHREIELYVEAGFTPMEAIQAATIVPARAMKLDRELGTIEAGKRADLVVLNANPLDTIRNIRSVRWTISGGRVYDSAALWKSVRFQP